MKASQLKALYNRTPGLQGVSRKTKAVIITELVQKLPQMNQPSLKHKFEDNELPAAKRALLSPTSKNQQILNKYNDHYGWLDQVDKDFYKVCNPTNNYTWEKTYGCSLIYSHHHSI